MRSIVIKPLPTAIAVGLTLISLILIGGALLYFGFHGKKNEKLTSFATAHYATALTKANITEIVPAMFGEGIAFWVETKDGITKRFDLDTERITMTVLSNGEVEVRVPSTIDTGKITVDEVEKQIDLIVYDAISTANVARNAAAIASHNKSTWETK